MQINPPPPTWQKVPTEALAFNSMGVDYLGFSSPIYHRENEDGPTPQGMNPKNHIRQYHKGP